MPKFSGHLQLRRAIFEHLRDGRLTKNEALAYIYIATQADTRTGIWQGSAGALAGEYCCTERVARRLLESLTLAGYLKRFSKPGAHLCYPILVNKYLVTEGEHAGTRLNATATANYLHPVYEENVDFGEHRGEQGGGLVTPQKRIKNKELKPSAKKQPSDLRFQSIIDSYYEGNRKRGIEPNYDKSDFGALHAWLQRNPNRAEGGILASLANAFASTNPFPLRPGFRLREFLEHEAKYQRGPILRNVTPMSVPARKPAGGVASTHVSDADAVAMGVVR